MGFLTDSSTGDNSGSRLCSLVATFAAILLAFYLGYKDHAGEAVTIIIAVLGFSFGTYGANSTARVIMTKGMPPPEPECPRPFIRAKEAS